MSKLLNHPRVLGLLTLCSLVFICFGISAWSWIRPHSTNLPKNKLSANDLKILHTFGKANSVLKIDLFLPADIPPRDTEPVEVLGYISLNNTNARSMQYHWELPEGVELIEGSLSQVFTQIQSLDPLEIRIKIKGFSKRLKKNIILSASTQIDGVEYGNSAMKSSRPEDSLEYVAPIMMASKQEERQALGKPPLKYVK